MAIGQALRSLLGISTFQRLDPSLDGPLLTSASVDRVREAYNGQIAPTPFTQVRWFMRDLESAQYEADSGVMMSCSKLWNAAKRDGVFAGVLSTRTSGLVRLPKKFRGERSMVSELELGNDSIRSVFDEMAPASELALLAEDGIGMGVAVGELMPVDGRDYPVLVRLPPENLIYWWNRNRWFYRSIAGLLPITPGDGRWVLHIPGGRLAPWQNGIWRAVGRAFIAKEHAIFMDSNWQSTLANPARVAVTPQGASEEQVDTWFEQVAGWGINSVFTMKPGWDVRLLESNGRGYESFGKGIERSEREMIIAVAGQEVTTDGGAGFQNSDIHKSIRADLIKATADALAYTVNTQIIPPWVIERWGEEALLNSPCVEWDVTPPRDRTAEATAMVQAGTAIKILTDELRRYGEDLDIIEFCDRFSIPRKKDGETGVAAADIEALSSAIELARKSSLLVSTDSIQKLLERATGAVFEAAPETTVTVAKLDLAPTDIAKVVKVDEVRASQGLPPIGDERGEKTIIELDGSSSQQAQPDEEAAA